MIRVEVLIAEAYVRRVYGGGGIKVAVSVTVPGSGVSSVVEVGDPVLADVDDPVDGMFWSLVCGLGGA
jgi:hypothetical protein